MNTLIWFVILYWVISVGIGIYAARYVRNSNDFAVAGRSLPMSVVTATVFATWFGSEAVLGIPATFVEEGFRGVIADPFGSGMCLMLVGILFAKRLYRMNLMTISDYYRNRFGRAVEILVTLCIVVSYLGWVAAQIKALGLVFNVVSGGAISMNAGMIIGAASVLIYTLMGGMWSVAITDFLQMIIIVIGILYISWEVSGMVGGAHVIISHAAAAGKLNILPKAELRDILWFLAAWFTLMFGSMPQQDVFQRIASSRSEKIARNASILGGGLYVLFALVPMFLCYSATLIDPAMVDELIGKDAQLILPTMIMAKMPVFAQIMFFGALLSAIKSCASATLLAPSVTFSENVIKEMLPGMSDRQSLFTMRVVVLVFAAVVTGFAMSTDSNIFQMVENAYKVTLVAAFVPLIFGFYWKRANSRGALTSMILGLITWIGMELLNPEGLIPPQLLGLGMALIGMVAGSLLYRPAQDKITDSGQTA
ncbi:MAG: sodium:solute symporter family protein [Burkholderiaceae bacterium]|jgi:SSS family transporter|nr:sodium:solute symporter family protein [Burkholderiaceae bacterium]